MVIMIPIWFCGIYFNTFKLTPVELSKELALTPYLRFPLAAYALSCYQTTIMFKIRLIYCAWNHPTRMVTCPAPRHLAYMKRGGVEVLSLTSSILYEKAGLANEQQIEKGKTVVIESFKSGFLGFSNERR